MESVGLAQFAILKAVYDPMSCNAGQLHDIGHGIQVFAHQASFFRYLCSRAKFFSAIEDLWQQWWPSLFEKSLPHAGFSKIGKAPI